MSTGHATMPLPEGVIFRRLTPNIDSRGNLIEIYREEWGDGWRVMQFNAVMSVPGALRGMHVHATHFDYIVLLRGRMLLALHDIRSDSPTARLSSMTEVAEDRPSGILIPPGVAHGFYFLEPSLLLYGLSQHWDQSDELLCRWDAEEFGFRWPTRTPILSERDAVAGSYRGLIEAFETSRRAQGALPAGSHA